MSELDPRLRAVCDLSVAGVREMAGRHEYDGRIQDLSPEGVRAGLAALGRGPLPDDPYDAAHLEIFEEHARVAYGELELYRRSPMEHLESLDLACYDREYAPAEERAAARLAHLARWPEAVDNAIAALDRLSAPVATALLGTVRGLAAGVPRHGVDDAVREAALKAHARLAEHVEEAARAGDPDASLGADGLARLMGAGEGLTVDLGRLAGRADAERDRLMARLAESCAKLGRGDRPPLDVCRELVRDHPGIDGVIDAAREGTERAIAFTREKDLVPYHDGECLVGLAPESRRWAMAMISWAAPGEPESPSWYHITPPDPSWPEQEIEEWLEVFSATTLPAINVHEVAPGHFSHGRALRHASSDVRRTLMSLAFCEGWAHYAEELCVEEGFAPDDPRFEIGVWLEALIRVTRLACAIGVHTGAMTVEEGARRFEADTHLAGPAALSEARRATFDPTYGRYTWGKLEILDLRERARAEWGAGFTLKRFHTAMLDLGSPPLGLLGRAL
ncbi:hypothetical protein Ppa06_11500 [Planomonospora parontospora subsp. parontospora]|uniref:DUF885 domain-containing protein n=2 Tax=Planomonospora parontospora TaxID=58119 RepID=A0AA37BDX9_9ACTN|nr:DUF885 family protein [Planomonospora parontospora]GGK55659.1 hypothetical protein GCM10010126_14080 [Planomonospora parontospora]GII07352.1 hypothetical protein Ppa06_11500 [Planomonospora parontospora subsp. parontospora]